MDLIFFVYILASARNGTLYVGHTDDLINRVRQHREHELPGFTDTHRVTMLVWYEAHSTRESAFKRERQIKKWYRAWKLRTIEESNPEWRDLYDDLTRSDQPFHPDIAASMAEGVKQVWVPAFAGMSGGRMAEVQARDLPQDLQAEDVRGELYIPAEKLEAFLAWAERSNVGLLGMDGLLVGRGITQPVMEAIVDRDRLCSGSTVRAACLNAREWLERAAEGSGLRPVFTVVFE